MAKRGRAAGGDGEKKEETDDLKHAQRDGSNGALKDATKDGEQNDLDASERGQRTSRTRTKTNFFAMHRSTESPPSSVRSSPSKKKKLQQKRSGNSKSNSKKKKSGEHCDQSTPSKSRSKKGPDESASSSLPNVAGSDSDVSGEITNDSVSASGEDDGEEEDPVCHVCKRSDMEKDMLLCDDCDRGWHMHCLRPPLKEVPEGNWSCPKCRAKRFYEELERKQRGSGEILTEEDVAVPCHVPESDLSRLGPLQHSWKFAELGHFISSFGVELGLREVREGYDLCGLAEEICRDDSSSHPLLASLHVKLLAGSGLSKSLPLDESSWGCWLAKWLNRKRRVAQSHDQKDSEVLRTFELKEDENCAGGSTYNFLSPEQKVELLLLLCCEKLEGKGDLMEQVKRLDDDVESDVSGCDEPEAITVKGAGGVSERLRPTVMARDSAGGGYWDLGGEAPEGCNCFVFRGCCLRGHGGGEAAAAAAAAATGGGEVNGMEEEADDASSVSSHGTFFEEEDANVECCVCQSPGDASRLLLCDDCDDGYHIYCLDPPLKRIPHGTWSCPGCDRTGGQKAKGRRRVVPGVEQKLARVKVSMTVGKLLFQRVVVRRPIRAKTGRREFDVHYVWKEEEGGRSSRTSCVLRSLSEVHRLLNLRSINASDYLDQFDFSNCYDKRGKLTGYGREKMEKMEMKVKKEEKGRQNVFPKNSDPHVRWSTLCVDEDGLVGLKEELSRRGGEELLSVAKSMEDKVFRLQEKKRILEARAERGKMREEERAKRKQRLLRKLETSVSSSNILERRRKRQRVNYAENMEDGASESAGEPESERESWSDSRGGSEGSDEGGGDSRRMKTRTRRVESGVREEEGRRTRGRARAQSDESGEDEEWSGARRSRRIVRGSSESGEEEYSTRRGRRRTRGEISESEADSEGSGRRGRRARGSGSYKESSLSEEEEEKPRKGRAGRRRKSSSSEGSGGPARGRAGRARRKVEESDSAESSVSWQSGASGGEEDREEEGEREQEQVREQEQGQEQDVKDQDMEVEAGIEVTGGEEGMVIERQGGEEEILQMNEEQ